MRLFILSHSHLRKRSTIKGNLAKQIADAIGTRHHEALLTEQQFISQLEAALNSLDQPSFDGLNSYYVSQAVREAA